MKSKSPSSKPTKSHPKQVPEPAPLAAVPTRLSLYDRAFAVRALEARAASLDAVSSEGLAAPRTNVERAANNALMLVEAVHEPSAYARFERLPEFDLASLHELRTLASMALYTYEEAKAAGAFESEAQVSPALGKESAELEARMQRLCEHHFSDDPEIAPLLLAAAPGTSLSDRASDLLVYARVYEQRHAVASSDVTYYRPTDVANARALAAKLQASIRDAQSPKARLWSDRCRKIFARLEECHAEVRATWLWLERRNAAAARRFPSLIAGGRTKRTTRARPAAPTEPPSPLSAVE